MFDNCKVVLTCASISWAFLVRSLYMTCNLLSSLYSSPFNSSTLSVNATVSVFFRALTFSIIFYLNGTLHPSTCSLNSSTAACIASTVLTSETCDATCSAVVSWNLRSLPVFTGLFPELSPLMCTFAIVRALSVFANVFFIT